MCPSFLLTRYFEEPTKNRRFPNKTFLISKLILEKLKDHNREGKQETDVRDFLNDSFYKNRFYINKKETADWVIFNDEHGKGKVSVIIEMKSTQAKAEMLTDTDPNELSFLKPKLSNCYFYKISTKTCESLNRLKKHKIEKFPIKKISETNQAPFVEKVDEILNHLKKADPNAETSQLEAESTKWYLPSTASPTKK